MRGHNKLLCVPQLWDRVSFISCFEEEITKLCNHFHLCLITYPSEKHCTEQCDNIAGHTDWVWHPCAKTTQFKLHKYWLGENAFVGF